MKIQAEYFDNRVAAITDAQTRQTQFWVKRSSGAKQLERYATGEAVPPYHYNMEADYSPTAASVRGKFEEARLAGHPHPLPTCHITARDKSVLIGWLLTLEGDEEVLYFGSNGPAGKVAVALRDGLDCTCFGCVVAVNG